MEIGGSIGGVACTTNKLLHFPSAHVVIECSPLVLPTLERNRELNGCEFSIEPCALAYGSEKVSFAVVEKGWMVSGLHVEGTGETSKSRWWSRRPSSAAAASSGS